MTAIIDSLNSEFDKNEGDIVNELFTYLKFKSISTDPAFRTEIDSCSSWVKKYLEDIGFTLHVWKTPDGNPCLFAERIVAESARSILFYGHYDVQPVDPIELWKSDPFIPEIRNGEIYARGAVDDKGQSYYVFRALKSLKELNQLPKNINIKLLIEGEEECGSKSLPSLIASHSEKLKADYLYIVDFGMHSLQTPAITLGCRGIISMTVKLTGSNSDLHSGEHGGIVYNPLHALVEILDQCRCKETGKITIPNFYDNVTDLPLSERSELALDLDPEFYEALFTAKTTGGEQDFTPLESAWIRPTLEINGISGGYAGPGFKTVIPAIATAKVSCRLVPDQDPVVIANLVTKFLESKCPAGIKIEISDLSTTGRPVRNSSNSKLTKITHKVIKDVTGLECTNILAGGSIPIAASLTEATGAETLFIGYCLPDDQLHAPNEHFGVNRLKLGHATIGAIITELDNL